MLVDILPVITVSLYVIYFIGDNVLIKLIINTGISGISIQSFLLPAIPVIVHYCKCPESSDKQNIVVIIKFLIY